VGVELGVFRRDEFVAGEFVEMAAQFGAGVRGHAAANAEREVIFAGERPDIAFEIGKKLDDDLFRSLRDEIALSHFEFVFGKSTGTGKELIAGSGGQNDEVSFAGFAVDGIARLIESGVDLVDAERVDAAAGGASAVEEQTVQNGARVDDDGMAEVEMGAMILSADDFDVANELFWMIVVQKEWVALGGLVREAAPTRLFPRKMLVVDVDGMAGQSELFAAHCAGRAATDNDIVSHRLSANRIENHYGAGRKVRAEKRFSCNGEEHQTEPCEQYSTENRSGCGGAGEAAYQMDTCTGEEKEGGEVGRQQNEEDFAAFQEEYAEGQREPAEDDEREPERETRAPGGGRAGQGFEGIKEQERGNGEKREAHPALQRQPRGGGGEFEPAGDEQMKKDAGRGGAEKHAEGNGSEFAGDGEVEKDNGEPKEQEEAGEVVAFEQANGFQGLKEGPDIDQEKRDEGDSESAAPARNGGNGGEVSGGLGGDEFAEQRAREEQDAEQA